MRMTLLCIGLFLLFNTVKAQQKNTAAKQDKIVDSLKVLIDNTTNDSTKILLLNRMAAVYGWRNRRDEQLKTILEAIKLADKIQIVRCQAFGKYSLGMYYFAMGKSKEAISMTLAALKLYKKCGDKLGLAGAYSNLGDYQLQDDKWTAIGNYAKSSDYYQQIGQLSDAAICENQIGLLYFDLNKYGESLKHTSLSLKFSEEDIEEEGIINPLNLYRMQGFYDEVLQLYLNKLRRFEDSGYVTRIPNIRIVIGNVYIEKGEYDQAIKFLRTGIYSFPWYSPINLLPGYQGLSKAYLLKAGGETYYENVDSAIYYGKKALKLADQLQNKIAIENCTVILAQAFSIRAKRIDSKGLFNVSLSFFSKIEPYVKKSGEKHLLKDVYTGMANIYSALGSYEKAYRYLFYASTLKDSISNDESSIKIEKLRMQYEVDKAVSKEREQNERRLYEERLHNQSALAEQKKLTAEKQTKNTRILMGSGLLFLTIMFSVLLIRQRYAKKRAIERAQSLHKMAELELQGLRAQLNPHFMFNSLNAIQELILKEDIENSHLYLSRFAELLRMLLDNANQAFVSLRKEINLLELYLSLENLRITDLAYSFEVEQAIDTNGVNIPNMMLQPYIENALWHGLSHKKGKKNLQIRIQKKGENIICEVEDNGVGRKMAEEMKSLYRRQHRSKGMELLSKRFSLLSKEYGSKIETNVEDLHDNGTATGTRVAITIPYSLIEQSNLVYS